jgi:uncharacterized membrane protein YbhN (UPF0104 family)
MRPARAVVVIILGAALVAGALGIIGHVAQFSRLRDGLARASFEWIPIAICGKVAGYAGYITAYKKLAAMRGGPKLSTWMATRVVGLGFGATVVGSAAGGLATDYWALHRAGCSGDEALRRVLGLNTLQWLSLGVGASVAGVAAMLGLASHVPIGMALGWPVTVAFCFVAGAAASAPGRVERLSNAPLPGTRSSHGPVAIARWAVSWARRGLADAIGGLVFVRTAISGPCRNFGALLGFPLYWAGDLLTLYACLRAFDSDLGLAALVLAYATGYVATALPLPVGGAGGVDAALTLTLHVVGLPLATALLAAVVYRGVSFWLPILPAVALLPTVPRLATELSEVAQRGECGA